MDELIEKKYRLEIEGEKSLYVIEFFEGSFLDTLLLSRMVQEPTGLFSFLSDFLTKHEIPENIFLGMEEKKRFDMAKFILEKKTGGYLNFSKKKGKEGSQKTIPSSWICIFLEKTGHTLDQMKNMRWSEISFLLDGIVWNANEMTKEGQRKNQHKIALETLKNFTE